ncbi:Rab-3A-interacting protein [Smittium mucronatum]|uniref:Rab-3A-interacting protein n=1 Tax=Smittium mucronatum TaxID=133383 RepID=A0A1R0H528_9FUNG|nr:Rab-3A-interacting protein [Smittium mucronatum]
MQDALFLKLHSSIDTKPIFFQNSKINTLNHSIPQITKAKSSSSQSSVNKSLDFSDSNRRAEIDSEINQILKTIQDASDCIIQSNSALDSARNHFSPLKNSKTMISTKLSRSSSFPHLPLLSSPPSYSPVPKPSEPSPSLTPTPSISSDVLSKHPHPDPNFASDLLFSQIASLRASLLEKSNIINQKDLSISELQASLTAMNDKFVQQVNKTAEMALSKELVEAELEELSRKLFEEANKMVAVEKKITSQTERKNEILERKINELLEQLSNERLQSSELKQRLQSISESHDPPSNSSLIPNSANSFERSPTFNSEIPVTISFFSTNFEPISDRQFVKEFYDFIHDNQIFRSSRYNSAPFMRRSIEEDVEPCLRFGSKPRVSSRYVLEAITSNTLQIEEISKSDNTSSTSKTLHPENLYINSIKSVGRNSFSINTNPSNRSTIWDRFSGNVPANPNGCQTCGNTGKCSYRFKLGQKQDEDWVSIDTVCRDRLVSVCEFYSFIRLVANGFLSKRPISELINELTRLKLCMFYSRFGLLSYAISMDPNLSSTRISTTSSKNASNRSIDIDSSFPQFDLPDPLDIESYSPTFSLNDHLENNSDPSFDIDFPTRPYSVSSRYRSQSATISKPKKPSNRIYSMLGSFSPVRSSTSERVDSGTYPASINLSDLEALTKNKSDNNTANS